MQNNAIQLSGNPQVVSWSDVRESLIAKYNRVNRWLGGVSQSFSAIAGMTVTRREVVFMYSLIISLCIVIVCLQEAPLISAIAAVASIWLTAKLKHFANANKKIGEDSYGRE